MAEESFVAALYEDAEDITPAMKWRRLWGVLVEELRTMRRLVEAGVTVKIEGTQIVFTEWWDFYEWAHGRYHKLEAGCGRWIGDDN